MTVYYTQYVLGGHTTQEFAGFRVPTDKTEADDDTTGESVSKAQEEVSKIPETQTVGEVTGESTTSVEYPPSESPDSSTKNVELMEEDEVE